MTGDEFSDEMKQAIREMPNRKMNRDEAERYVRALVRDKFNEALRDVTLGEALANFDRVAAKNGWEMEDRETWVDLIERFGPNTLVSDPRLVELRRQEPKVEDILREFDDARRETEDSIVSGVLANMESGEAASEVKLDYEKIWVEHGGKPVSRPVAALDLVMHMIDFRRTTLGYESIERFSEGLTRSAISRKGEPDEGTMPPAVRAIESAALNGMTQYVSPEMMRLVTNWAIEMPPEPLFPTDIQFPAGMLVFGDPLVIPWGDAELKISALGYADGEAVRLADGRGITYTVMLDGETEPKDVGGIGVLSYVNPNNAAAFAGQEVGALADHPLVLADLVPWSYGTQWKQADPQDVVSSQSVAPQVAWTRRWLLAYFRLLWQEVLVPERDPIPRPAMRRFLRVSKRGRIDGDVLRVIRMRKIYNEAEWDIGDRAGSGSGPTHGYYRRPHWRTIYNKQTGEERKIAVRGHIVRPDLPFADRWDVVSVER